MINRKEVRRFIILCAVFDENLARNDQLKTIENEISKNIKILCKAREIVHLKGLQVSNIPLYTETKLMRHILLYHFLGHFSGIKS